ncbi:MAG: penicillin acylase family protein [Pirellulales bacterium]|nr:penicillin acylase family protein [Pirellulales bacterium]
MRLSIVLLISLLAGSSAVSASVADEPAAGSAAQLRQRVTIFRDEYGLAHIIGEDDEATIFGFGYVQAEDFFWQVEDVYILALGRYSEAYGPQGLNSDLLNRAFEIVPRSQRDFPALDQTSRQLYAAFVGGINYYLDTHPAVRPRLISRFEPWHVLAYYRHVALELTFRMTGLSNDFLPRRNPRIWAAAGSNGWAVSGVRTAAGHPMLLASPHMPWFGFSQLMEAHLHSRGGAGGQSWNFIGAGFYGSPMPAMGRNDRLGWTLVTNRPDVADLWRVKFTDPQRPLAYQYGEDVRLAEQWTETLAVRKAGGVDRRRRTFRKTHHGPIVKDEGDGAMLAAQISGLFDAVPMRQALRMVKARNLAEFRTALAPMQLLYMNLIYADCDANVWYLYNGRVPRRNPRFDWSQPVDGADPAAEWLGIHELDELPEVLNPAAGFVQNCNSTPFMTTDGENPRPEDFPSYMIGDGEIRNRRSLRSLQLLRGLQQITFDQWQAAAFDTEVYWARQELPKYAAELERLRASDPRAAKQAEPYLQHLLAWDGRISAESTAATLCTAWYELLYGPGYPGETMRPQFDGRPAEQLAALVRVAETLVDLHGDWKVPYGDLYRLQRASRVADLIDVRFADGLPSLPSIGGHGPMGVALAQYYTPSIKVPLVMTQRRRYAIAGTSYLAAWEFPPEGARGASLAPLGVSGDPASPHYFDQAKLLSEGKLKPELFTEQQVTGHAVRSYHPGDELK